MQVIHRSPTVAEYQSIRLTTGWDMLSDEAVQQALDRSLYSVCLLHHNEVIGCGRVVGDGGLYFYVQDVIVLPEYQSNGGGKLLMDAIMHYLHTHAPTHAFIGLMAAQGVAAFYEPYGFKPRPEDRPGMYQTMAP